MSVDDLIWSVVTDMEMGEDESSWVPYAVVVARVKADT